MPGKNCTFFRNAWTLFSNVSKKKDWVDWRWRYSKLIVFNWWVSCAGATPETWKNHAVLNQFIDQMPWKSDSSLRFLLCFISQPYMISTYTYLYIYISYVICRYLTYKLLLLSKLLLSNPWSSRHIPSSPVRSAMPDATSPNYVVTWRKAMILRWPCISSLSLSECITILEYVEKNDRNILLFDFSCLMTGFLFWSFLQLHIFFVVFAFTK